MKNVKTGDALNIVGRVTTTSNELPSFLQKDCNFDFNFSFEGIPGGENFGNVITGAIDNYLGGSYSYDYEVFNDNEIVKL